MLRLASRIRLSFGTTAKKSLEDDYEALSVLGQGSTSRVFLGIDIRDSHKVVLKIFKKMDQAKIDREISVLQEVSECQNIIPLEAVFRNEGSKNYTFVMTHYPGTTLNHLIKGLDLGQARSFMRDILKAVAFLHSRNIMHRDIKPSNVLVCTNERDQKKCRVFDFGLAERYKAGEEYRYTVGTKCYKPPEYLLKEKRYGPSVDVWCSGVVLAEMIHQAKPLFPYIPDEELMLKQVLRRCRNSWDVLSEQYKEMIGRVRYERPSTGKLLCQKGAQLSQLMMDANPKNRPTALECLKHPFFQE